jgi:hypothetical protein
LWWAERAERLSVGAEYGIRRLFHSDVGEWGWMILGRELGSRLVPLWLLWMSDSMSCRRLIGDMGKMKNFYFDNYFRNKAKNFVGKMLLATFDC